MSSMQNLWKAGYIHGRLVVQVCHPRKDATHAVWGSSSSTPFLKLAQKFALLKNYHFRNFDLHFWVLMITDSHKCKWKIIKTDEIEKKKKRKLTLQFLTIKLDSYIFIGLYSIHNSCYLQIFCYWTLSISSLLKHNKTYQFVTFIGINLCSETDNVQK